MSERRISEPRDRGLSDLRSLVKGNGHFRTFGLLDMIFFRRVRHMVRSRFGSSFL